MPYPTSWFSRTPSKDARSLIRTAWALAAKTSRIAQPLRNLIIVLSLKWPDLVDEIHQPAGTLAVGDDPFAGVADPCISYVCGIDYVIRTDIRRAHCPFDDDDLVFIIHFDVT